VSDFETAIGYLLSNEGAYVDNVHDSGGSTNFGITQHLLSFYRCTGVTTDDVKNMSIDEAKAIYKKYLWDHLGLSGLDQSVATALLDIAANMGEHTMTTLAQEALGFGITDGILGPITKNGLNVIGSRKFLAIFIGKIVDHYCEIIFLKGWLRRATKLSTLLA
jgi:lysozyme family protein